MPQNSTCRSSRVSRAHTLQHLMSLLVLPLYLCLSTCETFYHVEHSCGTSWSVEHCIMMILLWNNYFTILLFIMILHIWFMFLHLHENSLCDHFLSPCRTFLFHSNYVMNDCAPDSMKWNETHWCSINILLNSPYWSITFPYHTIYHEWKDWIPHFTVKDWLGGIWYLWQRDHHISCTVRSVSNLFNVSSFNN